MIQSFDADTMPNFRWTFSVSMLLDIADDGLHILTQFQLHSESHRVTSLDKIGFDTRTFVLHCG